MMKRRIERLELSRAERNRPNNGNIVVNYPGQRTEAELQSLSDQGIKIIDISFH